MARSKAHWKADWESVGLHSTGDSYGVHVGLKLSHEPDRIVALDMDPAKAESLGRSLLEYAEKVRKLNSGQPARDVIGP